MKRLFLALLLSTCTSLIIFLILMSVTFLIGFRRSIAGWGLERRSSLEELIENELKDLLAGSSGPQASLSERFRELIPSSVSLNIYDARKNLIFSQRGFGHMRGRGMGMGMGMMHGAAGADFELKNAPLKPLRDRGELLGYYALGAASFGADRANARFLSAMSRTIWISSIFSFAGAFIVAFFFTRNIAGSASTVSEGINELARGNLSVVIPEQKLREINVIAQAANELSRKLKKEEELRRQWAADVAHDLRTPVSALRSQLEGMVDGVLEISRDRISRNLGELQRMEALVDDLGELTRLESPEIKINPAYVDTESFIGTLKHRIENQAAEKQLSVEWRSETPSFFADEDLMLRAVSNILLNAVRHARSGGRLAVSTRREKQGYAMAVFNSGDEIPPEEIEKIFQRLYRGEYARKTPGSGLGLTIALRIAELHGGTVAIESAKNHGTTVTVRFKDLSGGLA